MTVEVGIINRKGAVLAADSALTVSVQDKNKISKNKIISTDKIFALSEHHTVGIMVYGNSNFTNIPWETVIKVYKSYIRDITFDTLQGYVDNFLGFLLDDKTLYDSSFENELVESVLHFWLLKFGIEYKARQLQNDYYNKTEKEIKSFSEQKFIDGFDDNFIKSFLEKHKQHLMTYMSKHEVKLDNRTQENLVKLSAYTISKSKVLLDESKPLGNEQPQSSGIVITGFGRKEIYPMICEYVIVGRINGKLIYEKKVSRQIDTASTNKEDAYGYVFPYAQTDVIKTYITGIDPKLREEIKKEISSILDNLFGKIQQVMKEHKIPYIDEFNKYGDKINKVGQILKQEIEYNFESIITEEHFFPFFTMLNYLGKVELATLAEALVNLTITRRKFSTDEETVSGATDVAIITKGEGFRWIKRKETGKPEINISDFI